MTPTATHPDKSNADELAWMGVIRFIYLAVFGVCAAVQLGIGASFWLVFVSSIVCALGLVPLSMKRLYPTDFVMVGVVIYTSYAGLAIKTALLQPLESNLFAPDASGLYLLIGFLSFFFGYALSLSMRNRHEERLPFAGFADPSLNQGIIVPVFAVGALTQVIHQILRPNIVGVGDTAAEGFGGFGGFYFLMLLGLSLQVGLTFSGRASRRTILILVSMLLTVVFISLIGNAKRSIVDAALILSLGTVIYGVRINLRVLAAAVFAFWLTSFIIGPVIHITRASDPKADPLERISIALEILDQLNWDISELNRAYEQVLSGYSGSTRSDGTYVYPQVMNVDRFALILPIDQVARRLDLPAPTRDWTFEGILQNTLPSFLIQKSTASPVDWLAWYYGFRTQGVIGRPVIGLTASVLGQYRVLWLPIIPLLLSFISFTIWDRISGPMRRNAWALFLAANLMLTAERDVATYVGFMLRDLPIVLVVSYLILRFAQRRKTAARPTLLPSGLGSATANPSPPRPLPR